MFTLKFTNQIINNKNEEHNSDSSGVMQMTNKWAGPSTVSHNAIIKCPHQQFPITSIGTRRDRVMGGSNDDVSVWETANAVD